MGHGPDPGSGRPRPHGGSLSVVVGDIDTGLDFTHPDLAPNEDFSESVSCVGGVPDQDPAAWMDVNGHGTHTAGTIAAARNGIGMVSVAPNVKIAGIKAGNDDGFFFPEAVVYQSDDLAHPTQDVTSPDDTTPVTREISNACALVPVEVPGVIGVTANGNKLIKSFYSSYGVGRAHRPVRTRRPHQSAADCLPGQRTETARRRSRLGSQGGTAVGHGQSWSRYRYLG